MYVDRAELPSNERLEVRFYREARCWREKEGGCPGTLILAACGSSDLFPGVLYCAICSCWKKVAAVRDADNRIALAPLREEPKPARKKIEGFGAAMAEIRRCAQGRP